MNTINKVMHILNQDPRTRDNDNILIARFWFDEMTPEQRKDSVIQFLVNFSENRFTSAESIRRCRQKLQEDFPGLRGKSYLQRKKVKYQTIFQ